MPNEISIQIAKSKAVVTSVPLLRFTSRVGGGSAFFVGRFAFMSRFIIILFAVMLLPSLAVAKRGAPAKVEPVVYLGIKYTAPNNDGRRGYIEAWDVETNKKLWALTVFTNQIDRIEEEDVQWVFITKLQVRAGLLVVTSESGKSYKVDLKTKKVTQSERPSNQPSLSDSEVRQFATKYRDDWLAKSESEDVAVLARSAIVSVEKQPQGWHIIFKTPTGHSQTTSEGMHDYYLHIYIKPSGEIDRIVRGPDLLS